MFWHSIKNSNICRPANYKGKSQRVLKGTKVATMFLGILAKERLACTGISWEIS